jgi:hypothetical protein
MAAHVLAVGLPELPADSLARPCTESRRPRSEWSDQDVPPAWGACRPPSDLPQTLPASPAGGYMEATAPAIPGFCRDAPA